ncbi:MAG: YoaK family protein [Hyphomicrobium sp.]|uniref:YoaK family protein n=1 Tax=Hyphomicrobium sp. TaxID=82 RepID=UPI003D142737
MRPSVPLLLSFNAGYVDTAGFLALHGLFTAHVTGNFVTFGAALALGTSGALAKLLALPVFCIVVMLVRLLGREVSRRGAERFTTLLMVKVLLLTLGAILAVRWGPFGDGDGWQAVVTGMALVAAMAIQNAVHRVHLAKSPPTTIMTGSSTQMMMDIADVLAGGLEPEERQATLARVRFLGTAIAAFASGCAVAAVVFVMIGVVAFAIPPVIALASALLARTSGEPAPA